MWDVRYERPGMGDTIVSETIVSPITPTQKGTPAKAIELVSARAIEWDHKRKNQRFDKGPATW